MATRNLTLRAVIFAAVYVLTSGAFAYVLSGVLQGAWRSGFLITSVPMILVGVFFVAGSAGVHR